MGQNHAEVSCFCNLWNAFSRQTTFRAKQSCLCYEYFLLFFLKQLLFMKNSHGAIWKGGGDLDTSQQLLNRKSNKMSAPRICAVPSSVNIKILQRVTLQRGCVFCAKSFVQNYSFFSQVSGNLSNCRQHHGGDVATLYVHPDPTKR